MKTRTIISIVVVMLACSSCRVDIESKPTAGKILEFGAGFASGLLSHEAGHYVVAKAEELDEVRFRGTKITYSGRVSGAERRMFYGAGFGADVISSEILMSSNRLFPKDNTYVLGWLAWSVFEPFSYTARNEFGFWNRDSDLRGLRDAGVSPRAVEIGLIAHACLTYYRLSRNPDFPIHVSFAPDRFLVGAEWRF